jgi:hypothetical protein
LRKTGDLGDVKAFGRLLLLLLPFIATFTVSNYWRIIKTIEINSDHHFVEDNISKSFDMDEFHRCDNTFSYFQKQGVLKTRKL